jgi:PBP1b-binding outer membrane lipoprotein LpoB
MKILNLLAIAAGLLLAGCSEKSSSSSQTNATTTGNPLTAPVDYLSAAANAEHSAVKTVDVTSLNQAIQMFNVEKGRNPKDLNELVTEKIIPKLPTPPFGTKLDYDPNTGTVKVVKQ